MKALQIAEIAPDFTTKDHNGNEINLSELTKTKDVLLFFYRGQ